MKCELKKVRQSILQRVGIRQLPGICKYSAKCVAAAANQGGTTDKAFYSSLADKLSRAFFIFIMKVFFMILLTKRW